MTEIYVAFQTKHAQYTYNLNYVWDQFFNFVVSQLQQKNKNSDRIPTMS